MAQYSYYRPWAATPWAGSFEQLRREMDSLFHRFGNEGAATGTWRGAYPAVNLYETEDAYVLSAELPGLTSDDIQVALEGSTVTISGERKIDYTAEEGVSVHRAERSSGSFRRAFQLPISVDAEKVEAGHRNGVLMVRLPKTPEAKPRQIAIEAS